MFVCNYCGRYLKNEYKNCPGCGSTSFSTVSWFGEKIIKDPPPGGYKLNMKNYESIKKASNIAIGISVILLIIVILSMIPLILAGFISIPHDKNFGLGFIVMSSSVALPFFFIGLVFIFIAIIIKAITTQNIKKLKALSQKGLLVKNMPYQLVESGTTVNQQPVYCIKVEYENANGIKIPLISEQKFNNLLGDKDGTVDLLIDSDDFSNYYIDVEIY